MKGAVRSGVDSAGGVVTESANSNVFVEGNLWCTDGAPVTPHGLHTNPTLPASTSKVYVMGVKVCRQGDTATCGHTSSGSSKVFAG